MSEQTEELNLQYFLSSKGPILVVTFVGEMNDASIKTLEKCNAELIAIKDVKFVILYFRDTKRISMDAIPVLATMQKEIRKTHSLQICSMAPDMREKLKKQGVIRDAEMTNNLADAIAALKGRF